MGRVEKTLHVPEAGKENQGHQEEERDEGKDNVSERRWNESLSWDWNHLRCMGKIGIN